MNFTTDQFSYNKSTKKFVAEASELGIREFLTGFSLKNTKTDVTVVFNLTGNDYTGSGEDREIAGSNYVANLKSKKIHALIIND